MDDPSNARISVTRGGPLRVEGGPPLSRQTIGANAEGESWDWRETERLEPGPSYLLCRCNRSKTRPFCDDACTLTGWEGTETANDVPYAERARIYPGPELDLADVVELCAAARFCAARGSAWTLVRQEGSEARHLVERETAHCPSGRLVASRRGLEDARAAIEPVFEPSIVLVEDSRRGVSGPIWVRGGVEVRAGDGRAYEVRNRVTLCRCGASSNKPFCDGSHVSVRFSDRA
jgi:CDGSH-type Zn-finger protein